MVKRKTHPAVRISLLLIGATAISLGNYYVLATAFLVVAFCYVCIDRAGLSHGVRLAKRMRWFFLSIIVVYFWFTPGQTVLPELLATSLAPSYEGIELGLHRVFILLMIILMVNLLLRTTPQADLLTAIYWWLRPLNYCKIDGKRVSLRISLVLDYVQKSGEVIEEARQSVMDKTQVGNKVKLLGVAIGRVIHRVEQQAAAQQSEAITLPDVDNPPRWQWLLPALLLVVILLLQQV